MKPAPKIRSKKCKVCREYFTPRSSFAKACGPECAQEYVAQEQAKKDRQERQKGLQALKTKRDYIKEAQIAFNAYVRLRDSNQTCISCGASFNDGVLGGRMDCGHWRSVGSAPHLRFHEDNAHGQCKKCNRYDSGRAVDYRIGLIARIGLTRVERLESDNSIKKWTVEELQEIRDHYRLKLKQLKES
jgi:hypothetical protein